MKFHQSEPSSLSTLDLNANAKMSVIQAEIVGYGDLYLYAVFLTVHDKPHVKFHQPGPSSLSTLDLSANVNAKMSMSFRQK